MPGWLTGRGDDQVTQLTELGDPNFSPSDSSQGQVPAAAAEKQLIQNRRSAENTLNKAVLGGYDVSDEKFDPIRQQAETGVAEEKGSFVGSLIGWIDGPRQAINLFLQDIAGGEAVDGARNPNFGDYWNAFWGGVEHPGDFEKTTGLNPVSGSLTLDMFGWAEEDDLGGRMGRGLADFGLQVLTDPLTYVTFGLSGLGKKIALTASDGLAATTAKSIATAATEPGAKLGKTMLDDALEAGGRGLNSYEKHIARDLDNVVQEFWDDVGKKAGKNGELPPDMSEALSRWLGEEIEHTGQLVADPKKLVEAAVANRVGKEVTQPLLSRNFKKINALALEQLPAYAKGGARISVPFTQGTLSKGLLIPGTQGLGRKVVGDPIRVLKKNLGKKFDTVDWIAEKVGKGVTHMDQKAPLLRALKNGDIEGWQWHIASGAIDNMNNNAVRHQISQRMNAQWNHISDLGKASGVDLDVIGMDVLLRLEGHNIDDVLLNQVRHAQEVAPGKLGLEAITHNKDLDEAVRGLTTYMQETMNNYHTALSVLDPTFRDKFIAGYIPHMPTKQGQQAIKALAGTASGTAGEGDVGEDLLAQIINSLGKGGGAETNLGANRPVLERGIGRLSALSYIDDSVVMLDDQALQELKALIKPIAKGGDIDPTAVANRYLSVTQLNEYLEPIIRREAKKHGKALPPNWDGKVFNENPIETMMEYVSSMTDTVHVWQSINDMKAAGLAMKHATVIDTQGVIQRMFDNAVRAGADVESLRAGQVQTGEVVRAPTSFVESIVQPGKLQDATRNMEQPDRQAFKKSIEKRGVNKPVQIMVDAEGSAMLHDGHHRLRAALDAGIEDMEVEFVPSPDLLEGGLDISEQLRPGWFDDALAEATEHGEGLGGLANLRDRPAWKGGDALTTTPWVSELVEGKNILYGAPNQGSVPGVPRHVEEAMNEIGLPLNSPADVEDARRLMGEVSTSHPSQWANDAAGGLDAVFGSELTPKDGIEPKLHQWVESERPDGSVHLAFKREGLTDEEIAQLKARGAKPKKKKAKRTPDFDSGTTVQVKLHRGGDGVKPKLRMRIDKSLDGPAKRLGRRTLINWLDRAFKEGGHLEGLMSHKGLQDLIEGGMDTETAEILHEFFRHRMISMGGDTVEFLSKEPAEFMRTRALYDAWERGLTEFVSARAARSASGELITDPKQLEILGTAATEKRLRELKEAANVLGERGYDKAVEVMRDVEVYTGVALHDGFVNPAYFNLAGPAVEDLAIQYDAAEWLSVTASNLGSIYTPEGIAAAKLAASETLKWWRAMATLPRPAFHIRNLVGGSWMNLNFGVQSKTMAAVRHNGIKLRNAMRNATNLESIDEILEALPKNQRAAWKEALERNVLAGFSTTEFSDAVTPRGLRKRWDWAKAWDVDNFALTRAGGHVMESVEDFMRMSLFMQYFDETVEGSGKFAADLVNAVHFDYSALTPTETKLKSIIPFFVWTRRNLPLQIQQAVENPRYIQRYRAMMQAMDDNLNGDTSLLPEAQHFSAYAAGTSYKVNKETPFWARLMIDPDLPINDLLELPDPTPGDVIGYANDILGPHISLISDINFQRNMGDVNAPAPFSAVLQGLAAVGMYDRTEAGAVRIPYYLRTLMETVVPFSREITDPLAGGPTDPNRQARVGIHPDDGFVERGLKTAGAQILGGLGAKFTTPADARSAAFRSDEEIDQLIKELRLQGELPPSGP